MKRCLISFLIKKISKPSACEIKTNSMPGRVTSDELIPAVEAQFPHLQRPLSQWLDRNWRYGRSSGCWREV